MSINKTKGDAITFQFALKNKSDRSAVDITGWQFIAEIGDGTTEIKLASAGVSGGSSSQIAITNAANGLLEVYITNGQTTSFADNGYIEIASLVSGKKTTLSNTQIIFADPEITWMTP
jgi:hypothetical protein